MRMYFVISVGAFFAAMIATPAARAQNNCSNFQCPAGQMCGCEDCGPCNSGNFSVVCVCHPVEGQILCATQSGSCSAQGACAMCRSTDLKSGRVCTTYQGCTGQICPPGGCTGGNAVVSCANCVAQTLQLSQNVREPNQAVVLVPSDVPVAITDLQVKFDRGEIVGGSYHVKNRGTSGLVTLRLQWRFQLEDDPQGPTATQDLDSWATDAGFLAPGGEDQAEVSFRTIGGQRVVGISATIAYAEFEDGKHAGPGATSVRNCLADSRAKMLEEYKHLSALAAAGAPAEQIDSYLLEARHMDWLKTFRSLRGLKAAIAEAARPRKLGL